MKLILDGAQITGREALHDALAEGLRLPEWYGRNLDALHDCLTDLQEETVIGVKNREALERQLGAYGRNFLKLLEDISRENPRIHPEYEKA